MIYQSFINTWIRLGFLPKNYEELTSLTAGYQYGQFIAIDNQCSVVVYNFPGPIRLHDWRTTISNYND